MYPTLSSIGVSVQTGGTLTADSTKIKNALGNLAEVKKLFANADRNNSANDGIATKLRSLADNMLAFDGALANRTTGLRADITRNQKQQDTLDARAALYEKRLRAQYTALDGTVGRLNGLSSYLQQQPEVAEMLQQISAFLQRWLPAFEDDQRSYLTVAVGCTGGQHRSVYAVEWLARQFELQHATLVRHRELDARD